MGYGLRPQMSKQMHRVGLKGVGRYKLGLLALPEYYFRPQVSRKMQVGHAYPLPHLSAHYLLRDSCRKLSVKRIHFYRITDLYFNQKPIRLQHGPVKTLNLFLLILFSTLRFEECRHATIISAVLTFFLNKLFKKIIVKKI